MAEHDAHNPVRTNFEACLVEGFSDARLVVGLGAMIVSKRAELDNGFVGLLLQAVRVSGHTNPWMRRY